jgi:large subunit ribosomal protein L44e
MLVPKEMRAYCPRCNKHTLHRIKVSTSKYHPGRTLAMGTRRHARKLAGFHGKVKGKAKAKKIGIRQKIMLECQQCKKKHERVVTGRMKKKLEVSR